MDGIHERNSKIVTKIGTFSRTAVIAAATAKTEQVTKNIAKA